MQKPVAGWTALLLLICLASTIGSTLPVGYFLGILNTPAELIKIWCNETLLNEYDTIVSATELNVFWASIVSIFLIGGICGSLVSAWCSDKYGRKGSLLLSAGLLIVSAVCFTWCRDAKSLEMLMAGRFLGGIAAAIIVTAHPMYLLELAPNTLSGSVGVFTCMGITGGIFCAQIISLPTILGSEELWQYALSAYVVLVVLGLLPMYWFPESPRWLFVLKHDKVAASAALYRLRGLARAEFVKQELVEMEEFSKLETVKSSFCATLKDRELLLPIILVCCLQGSQQLSGINAIFYYSVNIFTDADFTESITVWLNLSMGFFNLLVSSLGPLLLYKFPRRPLLLISCAGCALALIAMSFGLYYKNDLTWLPIASVIFFLIFILFFQIGLAPIPYFIGSELLELTPRPVVMSLGSLSSWLCNFLIGMCFPMLLGVWGSFAFMPCAAVCVGCFLFTWRYLPETRGREPSQLKALLCNGFRSKIK